MIKFVEDEVYCVNDTVRGMDENHKDVLIEPEDELKYKYETGPYGNILVFDRNGQSVSVDVNMCKAFTHINQYDQGPSPDDLENMI